MMHQARPLAQGRHEAAGRAILQSSVIGAAPVDSLSMAHPARCFAPADRASGACCRAFTARGAQGRREPGKMPRTFGYWSSRAPDDTRDGRPRRVIAVRDLARRGAYHRPRRQRRGVAHDPSAQKSAPISAPSSKRRATAKLRARPCRDDPWRALLARPLMDG